MTDWTTYYAVVGTKPNPLMLGVLEEHVTNRGVALDLGAGNLRDSAFLLLKAGFKRVVAVDREKPSDMPHMLEFHKRDIRDFKPSRNMFDFAISCNTLFFFSHDEVLEILKRVEAGLRKDGIFACNMLGEQDDWILQHKLGVHCLTAQQASALRSKFNVVVLENTQMDGEDSLSNKKIWDFWTLVIKKP